MNHLRTLNLTNRVEFDLDYIFLGFQMLYFWNAIENESSNFSKYHTIENSGCENQIFFKDLTRNFTQVIIQVHWWPADDLIYRFTRLQNACIFSDLKFFFLPHIEPLLKAFIAYTFKKKMTNHRICTKRRVRNNRSNFTKHNIYGACVLMHAIVTKRNYKIWTRVYVYISLFIIII